ncbi:MAG: outer membrane beta-barrel protein [Acidobacteriaceae bacterium]
MQLVVIAAGTFLFSLRATLLALKQAIPSYKAFPKNKKVGFESLLWRFFRKKWGLIMGCNLNRRILGWAFSVGFAIVFISIGVPRLHGQVSGATLNGTVSEARGGVLPKARVSIRNEGTGEIRSVTTDSKGYYSAPNLLPGRYDVTVEAPGFTTTIQNGITLTVGTQQLFNVKMQVGKVSKRVVVTGDVPAVQLANATIGGVVNERTIVQLPLNGRDWTQLATLQPGVDSVGSIQANTGSPDRARRGYGVQMTISGTRPTQNSYRIDGINVNDYSNGGPGSVEGSTLGVDAVQEFSVLTSNYSAEYGRTSGGVINALTKSGTNQFHGDAYEFLRNSALDARNYFDPATIPEFRRNQFGAALGGPIWKDHAFFFGDYEGLRENQGITATVPVPSLAARQGILCSIAQPGVCSPHQVSGAYNPDPATGIDKAVLPFLPLWGIPNAGTVGNGDVSFYAFTAPHITSENFGTARVDDKFSEKDSGFGSFQLDSAIATQPDPANDVLVENTTGRTFVVLEETHIFNSQLVNSARFGLNRSLHTDAGLKAINPLSSQVSLGESPGADNPQIDVPPYISIQPGLNQIEEVDFFENSFQGYDDLFLTKGIQSLTAGAAIERIQLNVYDPQPAGDISFGTLADPSNNGFLTNDPLTISAPIPGLPFLHFNLRSTIFAGYAQDNLRLRPTLTVNLGLRYEMSLVPSEIHGHLSSLPSPYNQTYADNKVGHTVFSNPTLRNFEPRLGFAWDPFGKGTTSVRGGFAVFDVLPLPYLLGQFLPSVAPFTVIGSANPLPPGSFPTGAFNILAANASNNVGLRVDYIQPHPKRNYVMQWNLNVQREIAPNLTAMAAYVGSRGVHMIFRADDINTVFPLEIAHAPYIWPAPGTGTQISPTLGRIDTLQWNNDSYFDGMETQLIKRMKHGFQAQGSYTWSRAIDGGDGSIASDSFVNSIPSLFFFLPKYRRAPADFNITNNLVVDTLWNVPAPGSLNSFTSRLAKGWELGGIFQIRSGMPFTPLIGGDPLGLKNTAPFAYPDRLRSPACSSLVHPGNPNDYIKLQCFALPVATPAIAAECVPFSPNGTVAPGTCSNELGTGGRNEIYGPGLIDLDFSVVKDTQLRQNLDLQFRTEIFNSLNRVNFNPPLVNNTLFNQDGSVNSAAGTLDSTSTTSREIQFAAKLIF